MSNLKLSSEDREALIHMSCRTDASDLIEYFETQKVEQEKRDDVNLVVSIIAMIASVISVIIGLIALFI